MEELFIPAIVFKNGGEEDDLYFAGTKEDLMKSLDIEEFTEFFTKDGCGNRTTTIMARSANVDVVEIDEPDEFKKELRSVKEDDTKVIDITGLLDKLTDTTVSNKKHDDYSAFVDAMKKKAKINSNLWKYIDLETVSDTLGEMLIEKLGGINYLNGTIDEIYKPLVFAAMEAADATAFFLDIGGDDKQSASTVARLVCESIEEWMNSLGCSAKKILNALKDEDCQDTLIDDLFSSTLDILESAKEE